MPSWNWSTDWTTVTGVDFADSSANGILRMFYNALKERACALSYTAPNNLPAVARDLLNTIIDDTAAINWPWVQASADSLATYFCRPAPGGSWSGQAVIQNLKYSDANNSVRDRNFPYPSGWSRYFPRVIYTVSQSGTDGQRARFESQPVLIQCTCVLSTDPLFHTPIQTPSAEYKYSGKLFDHVSGSWQLSGDQASPPDMVSEFGSTLAQPGDYVPNGRFLNDCRDAINQLTVSAQFAPGFGVGNIANNLNTGTAHVGSPAGVAASRECWFVNTSGNTNSQGGYGTGSSIANADANWNVRDASTINDLGAFNSVQNLGYGSVVYSTTGTNIEMVLWDQFSGQTSNNVLAQTRDISWYIYATAAGPGVLVNFDTTDNTGVDITVFDAQGSGFSQNVWNTAGTDTTTSATVVNGPKTPSSSGTLSPPPNWPSLPPTGKRTVQGWEAGNIAALLNWAVTGGFTYVSGYAGT